jgi:hypothetical protein
MPSLVNIVELIGASHSLADISHEIPHIESTIHFSRFTNASEVSIGTLN